MNTLVKLIGLAFLIVLLTGCEDQPIKGDKLGASDSAVSGMGLEEALEGVGPTDFGIADSIQGPADAGGFGGLGENTEGLFATGDNFGESSFGGADIVPVEYQTNAENCGPASMTSIFNYHGVGDSQGNIASYVTDGEGARSDLMVDYARNKGFSGTKHISRSFDKDSLSNLEQRVANRPQIVRVGPGNGSHINYSYPKHLNPGKNWGGDYSRRSSNGHFMVVQGFTPQGNPVLMDPANQSLGRVVADRNWFDRHWTDTIDIK